jgi:hypothetical protein
MKILTLILLSLFFNNFVIAQNQDNQLNKELYERKIQDYKNMKRLGKYMMIGGGVIASVGIILIANYDYKPTKFGENTDDGTAQALVFATGVGTAIAGLVFNIIGSNKVNSYSRKLNSISFQIRSGTINEFALTYRF